MTMCIYIHRGLYISRGRERERDMYIHISIYICSPPLLDLVAPGCFMQADLKFVILDHPFSSFQNKQPAISAQAADFLPVACPWIRSQCLPPEFGR